MSLPDYQIVFISCRTGLTQYVLDPSAVDDLRYSRVLNDVGSIALTLPATNPYALTLIAQGLDNVLDDFIEVYRTDPVNGGLQLEDTFMLRLLHRFAEGDNERIALGGYSLNHLLMRRLVDPTTDPTQAGGYSTKSSAYASSVMREYVVQQAGSGAGTRAFPNFNVPVLGDFGTAIGRRLRYENLLDEMKAIALSNDCDFQVVRRSTNVLDCQIKNIGVDRRYSTNYGQAPYVILDPQRGNMNDPSILYDRKDEKNRMYAQGQGQGINRKVLIVSGAGVNDSPFNTIEFLEDVRSAEKADALTLYTQAKASLREGEPKKEFTFDVSAVEPGNMYRNDWDIGDKLTAQWGNFVLDLRMSSVEISISSAGETIKPKVTTI